MNNIQEKTVFQYFGAGIALGMYGEKEEISTFLNQLYNFGGHEDKKINYLSDNFGYVLATKEKLKKGMSNILLQLDLVDDAFFEPRGTARALKFKHGRSTANRMAEQWVENIPLENFLTEGHKFGKEYEAPHFK